MPLDSRRLKELFATASELPPSDRPAFLDWECGNDLELRQKVEALLETYDASRSFLQNSPVAGEETKSHLAPTRRWSPLPSTSDHHPITTQIDTVIAGRYALVEKIGEGGMGEVWVAQQTDPIKRKVAIKLIKAGMDSKEVLARFDHERQALAMMDHPNIAKVLDGGLTEDRRPFFVMELVSGNPLTKYCDERKLTPNQRLELFIPICQAIQHAHQKGIVHRDLKPSNILIAMYDGKPVPKVIDFGIAKATGGKLIDDSISTQFGTLVGTLEYMAPEQTGFSTQDIDTRADIYSLGVILYELLTGLRPFDTKRIQRAALDEVIRMIREEEPTKPSTRLSTEDSLPSLAATRQIEPKKLTKLLRGELDWVVMKCLEKHRDRRYETVSALSRDIQRYLADEAVEARPPSKGYRIRKFCKRNRVQVIAGSLVLFALLGGIAGTTYGLIRAEHRREEAEKARSEEANQRIIAEREKQRAMETLKGAIGEDVEKLIGEKQELSDNERTYLKAIAERWQVFAQQEGTDEQSQAIQAEGHFRVGYLWSKLGRNNEAYLEYEKAREIQRKLVDHFPHIPQYQSDLAMSHNNLGTLLKEFGKPKEAQGEYDQAISLQKKLVDHFPNVPEHQSDLAKHHNNLGGLLHELGKPKEAQGEYDQAISLQKKLVDQFPNVPQYRSALASNHNNQGNLLSTLGKPKEAQGEYDQAISIGKKLVDQFPHIPDYQIALAEHQFNRGNLLSTLGKQKEAQGEYEQAISLQKKLVDQFPNVPQNRNRLANSHNNLGLLLKALGKPKEAQGAYDQAISLQKKLVDHFPNVPDYQSDLAKHQFNRGNLLHELGKWKEAQGEYDQAISLRKKLVKHFPQVPDYQVGLGDSYYNLGNLVRDSGPLTDSLEWYQKAIQILSHIHQKEPGNVTAKQSLRNSHFGRAAAYHQLQQYAQAISDWDQVIELSPKEEHPHFRVHRANSLLHSDRPKEAIAEVSPLTKLTIWDSDGWYNFACIYAVASTKIPEKKKDYQNRAMELLQKAVQTGWKDAAHMAKDPDLDSLRERPDFKKLLESLTKNPSKELLPKPKEIQS
jgi:eukaryotic-like serine/threonine-protein kinase